MKKKYNIPKEARHLPIPGNQLSSTYESADRSHYSLQIESTCRASDQL